MKITAPKIKYQGKEMLLYHWAKELNMNFQTLYTRYRRGYDVDKIFSKDIPRGNPILRKSK